MVGLRVFAVRASWSFSNLRGQNVIREVVNSAKLPDNDRFDFLFQFRLDMRIGHFHFPTNTFAIIFNQEVGQDSFCHVFVLFAFSAKKQFTFWEIVSL